jgi:hypothetical protein
MGTVYPATRTAPKDAIDHGPKGFGDGNGGGNFQDIAD